MIEKSEKSVEIRWFKVFSSIETAQATIAPLRAATIYLKAIELRVSLARTESGWYAVTDACPHMGVSLSKGICNKFDEIVCPWHAYRFSLKTGEETSGHECGDLTTYPVKIEDNALYIGIPQ